MKREKIRVDFPEDANQDEINFVRNQLFKLLERHSCTLTKVVEYDEE
tara:strand:- start:263 stop:403 length:141 start_codon:yes stop_codon:yes gene_type:complete